MEDLPLSRKQLLSRWLYENHLKTPSSGYNLVRHTPWVSINLLGRLKALLHVSAVSWLPYDQHTLWSQLVKKLSLDWEFVISGVHQHAFRDGGRVETRKTFVTSSRSRCSQRFHCNSPNGPEHGFTWSSWYIVDITKTFYLVSE